MSQTSYSVYRAPAYEGQAIKIDRVESRVATANLPFGRAVQRVTSDNQVGLTAIGGVPQGVVIYTHEQINDQAEDILTGQMASVLSKGVVYGYAVGAVTQGALAYAITTVGADQGKFTATSTNNLLVGKFKTGGTNAIVEIDVDL